MAAASISSKGFRSASVGLRESTRAQAPSTRSVGFGSVAMSCVIHPSFAASLSLSVVPFERWSTCTRLGWLDRSHSQVISRALRPNVSRKAFFTVESRSSRARVSAS